MFCPSCSTAAPDGAKFCKSCGLNLTVVTQAVGGGVATVDPLREREYRRARKKISDGIHGSAIGIGMLVVAGAAYLILSPRETAYVAGVLIVGLLGVIKFFISIGHIIDAKVGSKLLDPSLQPRSTGSLTGPLQQPTGSLSSNPSRRLAPEAARTSGPQADAQKSPVLDRNRPGPSFAPPAPGAPTRAVTGRVNLEPPSPLRKSEKEDDLMSKLRN
ncbi:MAG: hypothetical protein ACREDR_34580 [Blastocatellia bacterium]